MRLAYDLHIHSCLSPCGDDAMTPSNIAGMAMLAGLDVFAVSDHNSARNCRAAQAAAEQYGLVFVPGIELTTSEEAHVLCLFPTVEAAEAFGEYIYPLIADIQNRPEFFGEQQVCGADDSVIESIPKLLISSTNIGTYDAAALVGQYGGVALPAHIDKDSFSVISNLGFFDKTMGFSCIELSPNADVRQLYELHTQLRGVPYITNSDAHALDAIPDARYYLEAIERSAAAVIAALREGRTGLRVEM